jgi:preprotein translocase subunit SecF
LIPGFFEKTSVEGDALMELFRNTHFDFLGRKWWFILPSLILTLAGLASIMARGGLLYGIDFRGGAQMEVRWEGPPPIEQIRTAVSSRLKGVSVVAAHDLTGSSEVIVSAELPAGADLSDVRQTVDQALSTSIGMPGS